MNDQIKEILQRDITERATLRKSVSGIKNRQVIQIVIGILIFVMFLVNYIKLNEQIRKNKVVISVLTDALKQGNSIIEGQNEIIDSLQKKPTE